MAPRGPTQPTPDGSYGYRRLFMMTAPMTTTASSAAITTTAIRPLLSRGSDAGVDVAGGGAVAVVAPTTVAFAPAGLATGVDGAAVEDAVAEAEAVAVAVGDAEGVAVLLAVGVLVAVAVGVWACTKTGNAAANKTSPRKAIPIRFRVMRGSFTPGHQWMPARWKHLSTGIAFVGAR